VIGYTSRPDGAILPLGIACFVAAIKFRRPTGCMKVFLREIFSVTASKQIFGDFSVGIELENEKT